MLPVFAADQKIVLNSYLTSTLNIWGMYLQKIMFSGQFCVTTSESFNHFREASAARSCMTCTDAGFSREYAELFLYKQDISLMLCLILWRQLME